MSIRALARSQTCMRPSGSMAQRAAQRVELMCRAQADLWPDPHCLDAAPSGAMQLSHRESVVQFINEARRRPAPLTPPAPSTLRKPIAPADSRPRGSANEYP